MNQYEAEAYTALLGLGASSAAKLSKQSTVPYGKIYESLHGLESKGFVVVEPGTPKHYKAVEPKKAMLDVVARREDKLEATKKNAEKVIKVLAAQKPMGKEETMTVVRGEESAVALRAREWDSAKKSYAVIVSPHVTTTAEHAAIWDSIIKARKRGVRMRFIRNLATEEEKKKARFETENDCEVRTILYDPGITFGVVDRRTVRFELPDARYGRINMIIQNKALAKTFTEYFEGVWKKAKPFARGKT